MDIYSFLRANGPLLAVIGILASIMAIIIVGSRYLRASPSSRKGIITAMAMPFALLSVSTLAACNSGNNPGSIDRRATPTNTVPRVPSEPSSPGGHQQPIANAIYASPGDDLQKKARSLSAGQTLILRDGTYSKLMVEGMHGSQASPITIHAEHDGQAITDGGFSDPAINVNHSSYVVVEGLVARNGGP